jgi:signal transduction histidine kinase
MASIVLGFNMIAVGGWVSGRIEEGVFRSSAGAIALYMANVIEPHVQSLEDDGQLSTENLTALDRLRDDLALHQHVASIKLWRPDGTIVYASHRDLIGRKFPIAAIEPSLRGEIRAAKADLDEEDSDFERGLAAPLYELFTPLYKTGTGTVLAVGELYQKADSILAERATAVRSSWLVVAGSAAGMLIALFVIVHRGSEMIERQKSALGAKLREETRLRRTNSQLEQKMRDAMSQSSRIDDLMQRRLGVELHDGPAQLLTLVLLRLDEIRTTLNAAQASTLVIDEVRSATLEALTEIRSISNGMFLPVLEDDNPMRVLRSIIAMHERRTNSVVALDASGVPACLPPNIIRCIARVTQEALTNAFKHGGGGQQVSISVNDETISLSIRDAGPGRDLAASARATGVQGLGLIGMRYRVESVGGSFQIRSEAGTGTEVKCEIPRQTSGDSVPSI